MKKCLKVVLALIALFAVLFAMVYLVVYLLGTWWLTIGGVDITIRGTVGMGVFIMTMAGTMRDQVGTYLSKREAGYEHQKRKDNRRSVRTVLWATWFAIYFPAFAYGRLFYAYLTQVGLSDLILVLLYGIAGIFIAVPMPEEESEQSDDDSLDSAML